jgi:glucose-1-phosphate cytidylyltransferase
MILLFAAVIRAILLHMSDVTFDMANNHMQVHQQKAEPWKVTLVDTGETTMTGGRLKRVAPYLVGQRAFCFTYGDGVADIDIAALIAFHHQHGRLATVTAVEPPGRYGALRLEGEQVEAFTEKPQGEGGRINGGFFVLSPACLELIDGDSCVWETGPLPQLAAQGQLQAFFHNGFWQPMDTLREKKLLDDLWQSGKAPWKNWA